MSDYKDEQRGRSQPWGIFVPESVSNPDAFRRGQFNGRMDDWYKSLRKQREQEEADKKKNRSGFY